MQVCCYYLYNLEGMFEISEN